ncbi:unnamed protein product [Peniophora sp. CBMAI 1063]|nr:unnamed protein product [Peniophora sp. CBMAI 1063]
MVLRPPAELYRPHRPEADTRLTNLSLGKRGWTYVSHHQEPQFATIYPASSDDEHSDDGPYDADCVPWGPPVFEQGPGGVPVRVWYNRKRVRLEILKIDVKIDQRRYLKYAEPIPGDPVRWRCISEIMENDTHVRCCYKSNKHLVKRHVESMHMNVK